MVQCAVSECKKDNRKKEEKKERKKNGLVSTPFLIKIKLMSQLKVW